MMGRITILGRFVSIRFDSIEVNTDQQFKVSIRYYTFLYRVIFEENYFDSARFNLTKLYQKTLLKYIKILKIWDKYYTTLGGNITYGCNARFEKSFFQKALQRGIEPRPPA